MYGDGQCFTCLHFGQDRTDVVAQLTLWNRSVRFIHGYSVALRSKACKPAIFIQHPRVDLWDAVARSEKDDSGDKLRPR